MRKLLLLSLVLLASCTRVFVKDDGTADPKDEAQCSYEADKATASAGKFFSLSGPSSMGQGALLKEECLKLRGYHAVFK